MKRMLVHKNGICVISHACVGGGFSWAKKVGELHDLMLHKIVFSIRRD